MPSKLKLALLCIVSPPFLKIRVLPRSSKKSFVSSSSTIPFSGEIKAVGYLNSGAIS